MGGKVAGVSRGPAVEETPAVRFGRWLARERRVRGISVEYVAVRFKTTPERIRELESGRESLELNHRGRATARSLARTIGADPEEAAARLGESLTPVSARPRVVEPVRWALWAQVAALVLATGLATWGAAAWLQRPPAPNELPLRLRRPDHVGSLLGSRLEPGAPTRSVELARGVGDTSPTP